MERSYQPDFENMAIFKLFSGDWLESRQNKTPAESAGVVLEKENQKCGFTLAATPANRLDFWGEWLATHIDIVSHGRYLIGSLGRI